MDKQQILNTVRFKLSRLRRWFLRRFEDMAVIAIGVYLGLLLSRIF